MEKNVIELENEIFGAGESKDFKYVKIAYSNTAYLYEVSKGGTLACFEVFERKNSPLCIDFENRVYSETEFKEVYPKSNSFGVWAWCFLTKESALKRFNEIKS